MTFLEAGHLKQLTWLIASSSVNQLTVWARRVRTLSRSTNGSQVSIGMLCMRNALRPRSSHPKTKTTLTQSIQTASGRMRTPSRCSSTRRNSSDQASRSSSRVTIMIRLWHKCRSLMDPKALVTVALSSAKRRKIWHTAPSLGELISKAQPRHEASHTTPQLTLTLSSATFPNSKTAASQVIKTSPTLVSSQMTSVDRAKHLHRWTKDQHPTRLVLAIKCMPRALVLEHQRHINTAPTTARQLTTLRMLHRCTRNKAAEFCSIKTLCQVRSCRCWPLRMLQASKPQEEPNPQVKHNNSSTLWHSSKTDAGSSINNNSSGTESENLERNCEDRVLFDRIFGRCSLVIYIHPSQMHA